MYIVQKRWCISQLPLKSPYVPNYHVSVDILISLIATEQLSSKTSFLNAPHNLVAADYFYRFKDGTQAHQLDF